MTPAELEAVGLRVKPLEWELEHMQGASPAWLAPSCFGPYRAVFDSALNNWVAVIGGREISTGHKIDRRAQAACEAHHATRIAGELERIDHADS